MTTWVALLRGINVGGHHKVPMAELRRLLAELGCADPKTLIQSGNAVFEAEGTAGELEDRLSEGIEQRFGFSVPVLVRSRQAYLAQLDRCPYTAEAEADPRFVHAVWFSGTPDPGAVAALDPDRSPPDRYQVVGDGMFVHFPDGSARSKLDASWFDRQLDVVSTWRNWRTSQRIAELARSR